MLVGIKRPADFDSGLITGSLPATCRDLRWVGGSGWFMGQIGLRRGSELAEKAESLEREYVFVEAVLDSSFIHEEAVEDPCIAEVLYGHSAESEIGGLGGVGCFGWVVDFRQEGLGESGQRAFRVLDYEGVDGLVVGAAGAS